MAGKYFTFSTSGPPPPKRGDEMAIRLIIGVLLLLAFFLF
jgi:hypothetical protein